MKQLPIVILALSGLLLTSPAAFAKKELASPLCTYGKTEYINSKEVFSYKSNKTCSLKNGASWYCRRKQRTELKAIKKQQKTMNAMTNNDFKKYSYRLSAYSFKGKNIRRNGRCRLTLKQLTCNNKFCMFN